MQSSHEPPIAPATCTEPERLEKWLEQFSQSSIVYFKRLAANDTLATGAHQAGPYVPKQILFDIFPGTENPSSLNPSVDILAAIDSHNQTRKVRAVWYNNRKARKEDPDGNGGTRNEARITRWGGKSSPLLDPENTGTLTAFAFKRVSNCEGETALHVWVCKNLEEETVIEDRVGPVEPSFGLILGATPKDRSYRSIASTCSLRPEEIPQEWRNQFPKALDIVRLARQKRQSNNRPIDLVILRRRACEFEIFQSLEREIEGPRIKNGFTSVDDFLAVAQTIIQRRKSRSGRSLELHLELLLEELGMTAGVHFSSQPESEAGKRPDFIFPSEKAYKDPNFPEENLRMLAVKTTCKDRWRQVIYEAKRIRRKHLLTLQQGISVNQYTEMVEAGIQLVVPSPLFRSYPAAVRSKLMTLSDFMAEIRQVAALIPMSTENK